MKECDIMQSILTREAHFPAKWVVSHHQASVGLGNIWRFPGFFFPTRSPGGGATWGVSLSGGQIRRRHFLLVYIILALTFGYTMIVAETSIGRMTGKSPVGALQSFGKSRWLSAGGWLNAVIPMLIVPYYSVIGGWVIKYLAEYLLGHGQRARGRRLFLRVHFQRRCPRSFASSFLRRLSADHLCGRAQWH